MAEESLRRQSKTLRTRGIVLQVEVAAFSLALLRKENERSGEKGWLERLVSDRLFRLANGGVGRFCFVATGGIFASDRSRLNLDFNNSPRWGMNARTNRRIRRASEGCE